MQLEQMQKDSFSWHVSNLHINFAIKGSSEEIDPGSFTSEFLQSFHQHEQQLQHLSVIVETQAEENRQQREEINQQRQEITQLSN